MARELKIKVTPSIDKSLQKLMQALNSTQALKVKVDLNDGGLGKMLKSLNSISSKTVKVGLDVDGRSLNGLATRLSKLTDKKLKVDVDTNDSQVKKTVQSLDNLSNATKSISKSSIVIDVDATEIPATAAKLQLLGYTINDISKKSIPINLESRNVLAMAKNLEALGQDINNLNRKSVDISVDSNQIRRAIADTDEIDDSINDINQKTISPSVDLSNLNRMAEILDDISDKILGIAGQAIEPAVDLAEDSLDLYDTQKSFQMQMSSLGMEDKAINDIMKQLNDYGAQSKYSVADMLRAYSEFRGAGNEDPMPLIKGMAGLASYGEKPNQALQALIRNMTEGNETDNVYTRDWREIRKAIGASASKQIRDWFLNNKGIELTTDNFSDKLIFNGDFKQAIIDVGNQQNFQDMAQQTNTLSSAIENLKESFTVGIIGDMEDQGAMSKFTQALIKQVNDFTDAVPMVSERLSGTIDKVMNVFGKSFSGFNAKDFLTDIFDSLDSFVDFATPFIEKIGKLTNSGKDLGKFVGNIVKYAAELKMAIKGFKALGSIGDFASDFVSLGKNLKGGFPTSGLSMMKGGINIPSPDTGITKKTSLWSRFNKGVQEGALTVSAVGASLAVLAKSLEIVATTNIPTDKLAKNIAKIGVATSLMSTLYYFVAKIGGGIKGEIMQGTATVLAVGGSMVLLAKALEVVADTDIPSKRLAKNVTKIGVAVGAMSLLFGIMGKFGGGVLGEITQGAVTALGVSAAMILLGKAFEIIADIDINFEHVVDNVSKIVVGVGAIGAVFAGLGALTTVLAPVSGFITAGITISGIIAASLLLLSLAFEGIASSASITTQKLVNTANTLNQLANTNVPDLSVLKAKVNNLKKDITNVYDEMKSIGGDGLWASLLSTIEAAFDAETASKAIQMFSDFNNFFNSIATQQDVDAEAVKSKINNLKNIITIMNDTFDVIGGGGMLSSLKQAIESIFDTKTAQKAIETFNGLAAFVTGLNKISIPDASENSSMKEKIDNLGKIMGYMKTTIDKTFSNNFIFAALEKWTTGANAETLDNVVKELKNVIDFANSIKTLPNIDDVKGKIKSIQAVFDNIAVFDFSKIKDVDTDSLKTVKKAFDNFASISESVAKLNDLPNKDDIINKLEAVKVAMQEISNFDFSSINFQGVNDNANNIKTLATFISKLKNIATSLSGIVEANIPDNIGQIIDNLKAGIAKAQEIDLSGFDSKKAENIQNAIDFINGVTSIGTAIGQMQQFADKLSNLDAINLSLENIHNLVNDKNGYLFQIKKSIEKNFSEDLDITPVVKFVSSLKTLADSILDLDAIGNQFQDMTAFNTAMAAIQNIFSADSPLLAIKKSVEDNFKEGITTDYVVNFLSGIIAIANKLTEVDSSLQAVNLDTLRSNLEKLSGGANKENGIFSALCAVKQAYIELNNLGGTTTKTTDSGLGVNLPSVNPDEGVDTSMLATEVAQLVNSIEAVAKSLAVLQNIQLDATALTAKTQIIQSILGYIKNVVETYKGIKGDELKHTAELVEAAIGIANRLNEIPVLADNVIARIDAIKTAVNDLNQAGVTLSSDGVVSAATAITTLETSLKDLSANMTTIGGDFAQKFINGFTSGSWDKLSSKVQEQIDKIVAKSDLSGIGRTMANTLADGFDTTAIINKITALQDTINSLTGKEITIDVVQSITKSKVKKANGGMIPEYHSTGGRVGSRLFASKGTDTVPAMLTAGEYVLKRSVVSALGKGFLDKLNQMNLRGAFMALANKSGQQVVNNTTNNITQNVDNKASYMNGLADIGRVVRI